MVEEKGNEKDLFQQQVVSTDKKRQVVINCSNCEELQAKIMQNHAEAEKNFTRMLDECCKLKVKNDQLQEKILRDNAQAE